MTGSGRRGEGERDRQDEETFFYHHHPLSHCPFCVASDFCSFQIVFSPSRGQGGERGPRYGF